MIKRTLEQRIARLEKLLDNSNKTMKNEGLKPHVVRAAKRWFDSHLDSFSEHDLQCFMKGDSRHTFAIGNCIADLADDFPELYDYKNQKALLKLFGDLAENV